jgi:predicted Zn-dependent protease
LADKSRLQVLEEMVRERPADAFSRYALAMELKGQGRNEDALREFATLTEKNPDYVATYLIYGQLLVNVGNTDDAKKVLTKGQAVASKAGNMHAVEEIGQLLGSL